MNNDNDLIFAGLNCRVGYATGHILGFICFTVSGSERIFAQYLINYVFQKHITRIFYHV